MLVGSLLSIFYSQMLTYEESMTKYYLVKKSRLTGNMARKKIHLFFFKDLVNKVCGISTLVNPSEIA